MKNSLVYVLATACTITGVVTVTSALSEGTAVDIAHIENPEFFKDSQTSNEVFYETIKQAEDLTFDSHFVLLESQNEVVVDSLEKNIELANLNLKPLQRMSPQARAYISDKEGLPTLEELNELGAIYALPEGLLYSVMIKESNGNKLAESAKRAKGLFQFIPQTAEDFGLIVGGKDMRTNEWRSADAAARYLAWIFTYFHPDEDRSDIENYKYVLAGYNAGISNVKKGRTLKIPNFKETKDYVRLVIGFAQGDYYKVKRGDQVKSIAKKHNLSIIELARMNGGVKQETLIADRYLLVNKEMVVNSYEVKKGDTLYNIAKRHSTSVEDLVVANSLTNNVIRIGQELALPF